VAAKRVLSSRVSYLRSHLLVCRLILDSFSCNLKSLRLFFGLDVEALAAADFELNLINFWDDADTVTADFRVLEAGGAQHVDQGAPVEHLGHTRSRMEEIAPAMVQGDALQEFLRCERIGIGKIFASHALEVGDDDAHDASGSEHLPTILGEREGFVARELMERVGEINVFHAVGCEREAFADVVALNILGPGGRLQDGSYQGNSREQDRGGVVEVVPAADSGEAAADVDFNFRGRHVPHMLAKSGANLGPRWSVTLHGVEKS
jgi:hypothetical protein